MENFVLPTLPETGMSNEHQKELLLIQATTQIVSTILQSGTPLSGDIMSVSTILNLIRQIKTELKK